MENTEESHMGSCHATLGRCYVWPGPCMSTWGLAFDVGATTPLWPEALEPLWDESADFWLSHVTSINQCQTWNLSMVHHDAHIP